MQNSSQSRIPQEERRNWRPKELTAILGEHRGRHWDKVTAVAVSPDSKLLVTADECGLHVWTTDSLEELAAEKTDPSAGRIEALAFNAEGTWLAAAYGRKVQVWSISVDPFPRRKRFLVAFAGHTETVRAVAFAPDGKTLISSALNEAGARGGPGEVLAPSGEVIRWEVGADWQGCRHLRTMPHDGMAVDAQALAPDGSWLVEHLQGNPNRCRLWKLGPGGLGKPFVLRNVSDPFAFSKDGKQLVATGGQDGVRLWDLSGEEPKETPREETGERHYPRRVAFSPDGTVLASIDHDKKLLLWPLTKGARRSLGLAEGESHREFPLGAVGECLAFWPDGKAVAVGDQDGRVQVRELPTGRERFAPRGHRSPINVLAVSPDCRGLVSAAGWPFGEDGDVHFWDLAGGKCGRPDCSRCSNSSPPG